MIFLNFALCANDVLGILTYRASPFSYSHINLRLDTHLGGYCSFNRKSDVIEFSVDTLLVIIFWVI